MANNKKFKSIKKRLILISSFIILGEAILTTTYCYFSYQSILFDSLKQSSEYRLSLLAETIQYDISNALSLMDFCTSNSTISSYLSASNNQQENTSFLANHAWQRLQEEYLSNSSSIYLNRVIISDLNDNYIQISPSIIYQNLPCAQLIRQQPFFDELYHSPAYIQTGFVEDPIMPYSQNTFVIPIVKPIYSVYGKEISGWCYLAILPNIFINRLKSYSLPSDSEIYLTIADKIYKWNNGLLTESVEPDPVLRRHQTLVSYMPENSNWYVSESVSQISLNQQTMIYMSTLIIIIGIVISLGIAATFYLHYIINIPLHKIQKKVQSISAGDFNPDPNIEWNNELGQIGQGINSMGIDISQLIQSHIEDQEKKYELEYEILQNQVNPHFLYNTLNSIIWMSTAQGANGITEMATSLAFILKSISKKTTKTHSVREELELLDHYFLTQKYRYGGGLHMNYTVEQETLYDCIVPKFTLQIVVENAIFHGIAPKGTHGTIDILIKYTNDNRDVFISVTDNGIGMTETQINEIFEGSTSSSELFRKIGINNIQKRIQYAYGFNYGISIQSSLGNYTKVIITVPDIKGESSLVQTSDR